MLLVNINLLNNYRLNSIFNDPNIIFVVKLFIIFRNTFYANLLTIDAIFSLLTIIDIFDTELIDIIFNKYYSINLNKRVLFIHKNFITIIKNKIILNKLTFYEKIIIINLLETCFEDTTYLILDGFLYLSEAIIVGQKNLIFLNFLYKNKFIDRTVLVENLPTSLYHVRKFIYITSDVIKQILNDLLKIQLYSVNIYIKIIYCVNMLNYDENIFLIIKNIRNILMKKLYFLEEDCDKLIIKHTFNRNFYSLLLDEKNYCLSKNVYINPNLRRLLLKKICMYDVYFISDIFYKFVLNKEEIFYYFKYSKNPSYLVLLKQKKALLKEIYQQILLLNISVYCRLEIIIFLSKKKIICSDIILTELYNNINYVTIPFIDLCKKKKLLNTNNKYLYNLIKNVLAKDINYNIDLYIIVYEYFPDLIKLNHFKHIYDNVINYDFFDQIINKHVKNILYKILDILIIKNKVEIKNFLFDKFSEIDLNNSFPISKLNYNIIEKIIRNLYLNVFEFDNLISTIKDQDNYFIQKIKKIYCYKYIF